MLYVFQKPEPLPEILWEPFFFLSLNDFVFRSISFKAKCIKLITFASRLGLKICQWNDNHRSLLESRAVGTGVGRGGGILGVILSPRFTPSQAGGHIVPTTFLLPPTRIFWPSYGPIESRHRCCCCWKPQYISIKTEDRKKISINLDKRINQRWPLFTMEKFIKRCIHEEWLWIEWKYLLAESLKNHCYLKCILWLLSNRKIMSPALS